MSEDQATINIREDVAPGVIVVSPSGEVDMSRSPELRETLRSVNDKKPNRLVIDLATVSYMDSSGLATLVESMRSAKNNGTHMVLAAMNDRVRAIFEIARLDQYFNITDDVDAALES